MGIILYNNYKGVIMNIKEAKAIVGGLSNPSKMPGYGYGLSAFDCAVGSKLRLIKNSTCSMCYALKGRYTFPGVKNAHANRLEAITKSNWVEAMVLLINNYGKKIPYFRWHDSGDLQSVDHLKKNRSCCNAHADSQALAADTGSWILEDLL